MKQIPTTDHNEWRELLTGQSHVNLSNFFFKMKVEQIRKQIEEGAVFLDIGIEELYNVCLELAKTRDISKDIEAIFGEVNLNKDNHQTSPAFAVKKTKDREVISEDISTRIMRIQEEAVLKRKAFEKETLKNKTKNRTLTNSTQTEKHKEMKLESDTRTSKLVENSKTKEAIETASKNSKSEEELARKASITRRNKELRNTIKRDKPKEKKTIGRFIKSIFH